MDSINLNEGTVFPVIELSIYDKYDNHSFEGNVGVITIDGSFTSTRAHIIPLATEEPAAGVLAIVSGWGPSHVRIAGAFSQPFRSLLNHICLYTDSWTEYRDPAMGERQYHQPRRLYPIL